MRRADVNDTFVEGEENGIDCARIFREAQPAGILRHKPSPCEVTVQKPRQLGVGERLLLSGATWEGSPCQGGTALGAE